MKSKHNQDAQTPPCGGSGVAGYINMGDTEYFLTIEELLRLCTPHKLGYAKGGALPLPGIVLQKQIKDKSTLLGVDIDTLWIMTHDHGKIDKVFLKFTFKADVKPIIIIICIDKFSVEVLHWLKLLVANEGVLVLNDSITDIHAIQINSVALDVPNLILYNLRGHP